MLIHCKLKGLKLIVNKQCPQRQRYYNFFKQFIFLLKSQNSIVRSVLNFKTKSKESLVEKIQSQLYHLENNSVDEIFGAKELFSSKLLSFVRFRHKTMAELH